MAVDHTGIAWVVDRRHTLYRVSILDAHCTKVHAIDRKTGKYQLVRERLPFVIVGAGVSTCAPVLERG